MGSNITGTEPCPLYAALDVKTGKVAGKTAQRHTSAEFIEFLSEVVEQARWAKEIHIVLDKASLSRDDLARCDTRPESASESGIPLWLA